MKPLSHRLAYFALENLSQIQGESSEKWGELVANRYIADLQKGFEKIASKPKLGDVRAKRSAPFRMIPVQKHFIVYVHVSNVVVVLAILHQRQNIEKIIADMKPEFFKEIENCD